MISASGMLAAIQAALDDYNDGDYQNEKDNPRHLSIMADAIKSYLEAHLVITFSWTGVQPPSTPDPVTSFQATVSFSAFDLSAAGTLVGLGTKLKAAVLAGTIVYPAGFLLSAASFLNLSLTLPSSESPENAIMDSIVTPLCSWITTLVNSTPVTGTHGSYSGSGVMTAIG